MLFNSLSFLLFFPVVFIIHWLVGGHTTHRVQNLLLLVASYAFYGSWDVRFLPLLFFSTLLDYSSGIQIQNAKDHKIKKFWLSLSILINLGILGIFKYYNFFIDNFSLLLSSLGLQVNPLFINIILPVGISFYTFHGVSYIIDIYNGRITPERNFPTYAVFVSFFPLLVAGPIERATHLLPQLKKKRSFDQRKAVDGLRQILWGFFKKIVIADNCAGYVNMIFDNPERYGGSTLVLGAILFSFQIYGDFSGYSDIAIGVARLLGIELSRNFAFPYFSQSIGEFWKRWHISLFSWIRDYIYIPLGGNRHGRRKTIQNIFAIFLISGFWHGANWTFIAWGLLNALYMLPSTLRDTRISIGAGGESGILKTGKNLGNIVGTFLLVTFGWVFFRSADMPDAITYISGIFSLSFFQFPNIFPTDLLILIMFFMSLEWIGRHGEYAISQFLVKKGRPLRWGFYLFICLIIFLFEGKPQAFIYFQF